MMKTLLIQRTVACTVLLVIPAAARAGDAAFDAWAEIWRRRRCEPIPKPPLRAQYFKGDEQDALDRRLTPITKAYRAEQVAFARRALADLAAFDREKLDAQQRGVGPTDRMAHAGSGPRRAL